MVPLKRVPVWDLAHAFVSLWFFPCGAPRPLLPDKGKQLTATSFQHVCGVSSVRSQKPIYDYLSPQANGQCKSFNSTVLSSLRQYVADHPTDWDRFAATVAYAYNSQIHTSTNVSPFGLFTSRGVPPPTLTDLLKGEPLTVKTARDGRAKRLEWLVPRARTSLLKAQERYRRAFERFPRHLRDVPLPGDKFTSVASGPQPTTPRNTS